LLIDGPHFIVGLITIFKQFHSNQFKKYLIYLVHFIKTSLSVNKDVQLQKKVLDSDATATMTYLEELVKFEGSSREIVS
jgi:hypothetical protein